MTDTKPHAGSDAARTGEDADKNRETLVKAAENAIDASKEQDPEDAT